ncbi:MAG: hypothetical protein NC453_21995 [Muribaculum sp.]|nr:hypothetical protein [Muribaculum sp.]
MRCAARDYTPPIWGKLYKRQILKASMLDIPREITNGEDALMNIQYAFAMSKPPVFCLSHIYNYTRNPISLSHSTERNLDYEYLYDSFRMKAIPASKHKEYLSLITKYRLNGILGCCQSDAISIAHKTHPFFKEIAEGIEQCDYRLSLYEWVIMNVKSAKVIRLTGLFRAICISFKYRLSTLLKI